LARAQEPAQLSRDNIIVLVVGGGVLFCVLSVIVFIICVCRKRDQRKDEYDSSSHDSTPGLTIYTDPSQTVRSKIMNLPIDDYNNSPMQMPPVEDKTTHIIQVAEGYDDTPYAASTNDYNSDED